MFMCGSRKFYQRGSKFDSVFFFFLGGGEGGLLMSGGRIKMPLLAGHHRPASETPFEIRKLMSLRMRVAFFRCLIYFQSVLE